MTLLRYDWTFPTHLPRSRLVRESEAASRTPPVDVYEHADRYVLRADLPGVAPADIEITAHEGVLTLRAVRGAEPAPADAQAVGRLERHAGAFLRRFTLPEDADADAISARSSHGVLELTIGKQVRSQPRRIEIQAA